MTNLKQTVKLSAISLALLSSLNAVADQVILDDLIVDGSICVGMDCVNGESFGFDTLRLKENNLRIRAVDTSSTASFPSRDWQITFNDSSNGGANKFSIDDIDGARTPFTIEAGAPSHSLYVEDGGRVGFGTSTPVVDLHVKSGNTPTLRLEQDGSSGFTPQTWDVAGNEANFFVRDATNGSTLPFRIFPGAPSNAINIEASTGDVGLGTTGPDALLHVNAAGSEGPSFLINDDNVVGSTQFIVDASGNVGVGTNTPEAVLHLASQDDPKLYFSEDITPDNSWQMGMSNHLGGFGLHETGFDKFISLKTNGGVQLHAGGPQINNRYHLAIDNSGSVDVAGDFNVYGTFNNSSSKFLKENFTAVEGGSILARLAKLEVVMWNYKSDINKTQHVGPMAEDFHELFEIGTDNKHISPTDTTGISLIAIKELNMKYEQQKLEIQELRHLIRTIVAKRQ